LFHERPVGREHLDAPVLPVGDVHHPVPGHTYGVHDAEILRARTIREALRGDHLTMVVISRLVAECAPHPLECTGIPIKHGDTVIAVTVGNEQLVGPRIHPQVRCSVQILCVSIPLALVTLTDLHDEFAVLRELQDLIICNALEPGQAIRGTVVSADPYEALVVEMDAVLAFGPFVTIARAAPGLDEVARRVEDHYRRRGQGGCVRLESPRAVQEPDMILRIDGEAGGISEFPFRRHLRPGAIHVEHWQAAHLGLLRVGGQHQESNRCRVGTSDDDPSCQHGVANPRALHDALLCSLATGFSHVNLVSNNDRVPPQYPPVDGLPAARLSPNQDARFAVLWFLRLFD
jgi:hypothetical protein